MVFSKRYVCSVCAFLDLTKTEFPQTSTLQNKCSREIRIDEYSVCANVGSAIRLTFVNELWRTPCESRKNTAIAEATKNMTYSKELLPFYVALCVFSLAIIMCSLAFALFSLAFAPLFAVFCSSLGFHHQSLKIVRGNAEPAKNKQANRRGIFSKVGKSSSGEMPNHCFCNVYKRHMPMKPMNC